MENDVLGFDVPVDYAKGMDLVDGVADLFH